VHVEGFWKSEADEEPQRPEKKREVVAKPSKLEEGRGLPICFLRELQG